MPLESSIPPFTVGHGIIPPCEHKPAASFASSMAFSFSSINMSLIFFSSHSCAFITNIGCSVTSSSCCFCINANSFSLRVLLNCTCRGNARAQIAKSRSSRQ